jgi:hypothetical protein
MTIAGLGLCLSLAFMLAIGVGVVTPTKIAAARMNTSEPLGPCDRCIQDCKGASICVAHCRARTCQAHGGTTVKSRQ